MWRVVFSSPLLMVITFGNAEKNAKQLSHPQRSILEPVHIPANLLFPRTPVLYLSYLLFAIDRGQLPLSQSSLPPDHEDKRDADGHVVLQDISRHLHAHIVWNDKVMDPNNSRAST